MSSHPNAILMLVLTPEDWKTNILADNNVSDNRVKIGSRTYFIMVMESDYEEDKQISAPKGSIVVWDFVTYGYGETIKWSKLEAQKIELEEWATKVYARHRCTGRIVVTANYW